MSVLLFLPPAAAGDAVDAPPDDGFSWLRIAGDGSVARGTGLPGGDDPIVAVTPADAVTLHWAELPSRSAAQAAAAARILVAEASAAPAAELHVAVGEEGEGERPIGVVDVAAMHGWLAMLARLGVEPVAMIPAPMLLPRPEEGYIRADLAGHGVVRGRTTGFADEARLTELVTLGSPPATIERGALDVALAAAVAAPPLDLRQGPFARRRRFAIDWRLVRRLAWLSLAIVGVTLATSLVRIVRYDVAADALEARADALAATGLPRGETITDADRQLAERTGRVIGPGLGFSTTAAAAFAAVRSVPGTELTGLDFTATGAMRLSVATEREALATDLKRALERTGFAVQASVFQSAGGRITGEMTVSPR